MVRDTDLVEDITPYRSEPDTETWFEAVARAHNRLPNVDDLEDGQLLRWNATTGKLEGVDPAAGSGASDALVRGRRSCSLDMPPFI